MSGGKQERFTAFFSKVGEGLDQIGKTPIQKE